MSWAAVVVGAVGAGTKLIVAAKQRKAAKALLAQQNPQYQIPSEVTAAASQGMPSEQYSKAMGNIQRQQMQAIGSSQDRRGGLASIGRIQAGTNDATLNLDAMNAKIKQQNQLTLAGYKDKQWMLNNKQPYDKNYNYGMQLLGSSNQNTVAGIDSFAGTIGSAAKYGAFKGKDTRGTTGGGGFNGLPE